MITLEQKKQLSNLLEKSINKLDITDSQFEDAKERYKAVGSWLAEEGSPLAYIKTDIKPQGSFRLGTIVRPWGRENEFDLDITFKLDISKTSITQQKLKQIVGDRLKENTTYKKMLDDEKRRCWRLIYAEGTKFHMDIVPCIPDDYNRLLLLNIPKTIAQHAVCITDINTWYYIRDWPKSNPEGYALWFCDRMKIRYRSILEEMRKSLKVDNIPEHKIKTPLQRTIQLLKRHRDSMFKEDKDKPISIILTTLAARSYENEDNLYDALIVILSKMDNFIKINNGKYTIENPVDPEEDFADKWNEHPQRYTKFYEWLHEAQKYFEVLAGIKGMDIIAKNLTPVIGEPYIKEALKEIGDDQKSLLESGNLKMAAETGILGNIGRTEVKQHNFFGSNE